MYTAPFMPVGGNTLWLSPHGSMNTTAMYELPLAGAQAHAIARRLEAFKGNMDDAQVWGVMRVFGCGLRAHQKPERAAWMTHSCGVFFSCGCGCLSCAFAWLCVGCSVWVGVVFAWVSVSLGVGAARTLYCNTQHMQSTSICMNSQAHT